MCGHCGVWYNTNKKLRYAMSYLIAANSQEVMLSMVPMIRLE